MPAVRTQKEKSKKRAGPAHSSNPTSVKRYPRPPYSQHTQRQYQDLQSLISKKKARKRDLTLAVIPNKRLLAVEIANAAAHKLGSRASPSIQDKAARFSLKPYIKRTRPPAGHEQAGPCYYRVDEEFEKIISAVDIAVQAEGPVGTRAKFVSISSHLRNALDNDELKKFEKDYGIARIVDELNRQYSVPPEREHEMDVVEAPVAGPSTFSPPCATPLRRATAQDAFPTPESLPRPRATSPLFQSPGTPSRSWGGLNSRAPSFEPLGEDVQGFEGMAGVVNQKASTPPPPEDPRVALMEAKLLAMEELHTTKLMEHTLVIQEQATEVTTLRGIQMGQLEMIKDLTETNRQLGEEAERIRADSVKTLIQFREYSREGLLKFRPCS